MINRIRKNTTGNAILISLGMTSFLFIVAAGATVVINASLQQSPKVVNSGKAFFAAEGAMESALFEASGRGAGYQVNAGTAEGDAAYINLKHLNNTESSWSAGSRTEVSRDRNSGHDYDNILFIPPRVTDNEDSNGDEIFSLTNWKPVRFGQTINFDLFVDNSSRHAPMPVGETTTYTAIIEPACAGTHDLVGPNGVCAADTKSIFGLAGSDTNSYLEDIFIDLYLPGTYSVDSNSGDDSKLLTWSLEAKTGDDGTTLPPVLSLQSAQNCDDISGFSPGAICLRHFDETLASSPSGIKQHIGNLDYESTNGIWVRLHNPLGIFKGLDHRYPLEILSFARKNITHPEGKETINEPPLYFPRLTLQLGQPPSVFKKDPNNPTPSTDSFTLSKAYIRVGFELDETEINADAAGLMSSFPLPDDRVRIQATGDVDGYKQQINVDVTPSSIAPMFDYAVFQP